MKPATLRLVSSRPEPAPSLAPGLRLPRPSGRRPLGQILLETGALDPGNLVKALAMQAREAARLGDILLMHGWVTETALMAALSIQWRAEVINLRGTRPDPRLIDQLGAETCLREAVLPWRKVGAATVVATARPDDFGRLRPQLEQLFGSVLMALAHEKDLHAALLGTRQTSLNHKAETKVPVAESCRTWDTPKVRRQALGLGIGLFGLLVLAPKVLGFGLLFWAILSLMACSGLKLAAAGATLREKRRQAPHPGAAGPTSIARLPVVSIMVPMFREPDIAARLIKRLSRLDYPRELLDILLVVEAEDDLTREALALAPLPRWMRVVVVPCGPLKTKPRALNFAMNFCRGSVIGVYDAEDAPEPDQLHRIVRHFHERGPEVACLQGILDFYNPRTNWLARCFTIEYASWFRVVLPGLAHMGLAIPLGGTTLFFRREALEKLGGWDAHNVTEDADLGIRLARHGYRAELAATMTEEEANCRAWPWIKQRSRWIKGYAMTYAVHMRDPALLWRQLGPRKFIGMQILFLGSLSQSLLAPLLWSFWLISFGIWHPVASMLPAPVFSLMVGLFVGSEIINMVIGVLALSGQRHRLLWIWLPTLVAYFPLATLAAYKAFYELIAVPFYWDKTTHGLHDMLAEQEAAMV